MLNIRRLPAQHLCGEVTIRTGSSTLHITQGGPFDHAQGRLGLIAQQIGQQQDAGDPAFRVGGYRFGLAFGYLDPR